MQERLALFESKVDNPHPPESKRPKPKDHKLTNSFRRGNYSLFVST